MIIILILGILIQYDYYFNIGHSQIKKNRLDFILILGILIQYDYFNIGHSHPI